MMALDWEKLETVPVVGILRGFSSHAIPGIVRSFIAGGLTTLEITMNSPDAADQIRRALEVAGHALNVGAGTVTDLALLEKALEAGASFIVTPTLSPEILGECRCLGMPLFPGAMTPTEVYTAWELGAKLVKVFPADRLGPAYIRAIKAPLPQVQLMPTGGVALETIPAYRAAGADAFGVGSPLFDRARIEAEDWAWLERQCRAYREAATQPRRG